MPPAAFVSLDILVIPTTDVDLSVSLIQIVPIISPVSTTNVKTHVQVYVARTPNAKWSIMYLNVFAYMVLLVILMTVAVL